MNESGPKIKQQVAEKIKNSTNILVTVSSSPSVDELSAAIGLTAVLNKLGKHGTAIFSGDIPPAINFLDPDKVFENTADSLRDFIIALDKEKADHLRYKVEGDVVKIFVTPYRTTITSDDLEFSQGDYNIELVLALGVNDKEHLDMALTAHGQVLQDVSVITFSAGRQSSQLGEMDWRDSGASSLSEMVTNLCELLKIDKTNILDKQISTALLTGIVAATDRFSNLLTTSRVMTTAAQLMAAGADQQLIAAKLRESHEIERLSKIPKVPKVEKPRIVNKSIVTPEPEPIPTSTLPDGSLVIKHEELTQDKSSNRKPPMSVNISNAPQNTALNIPPAKDVTPERSPIEETIENLSRQRDLREVEKKKEADEAGTEAAAPVAVAEPILSGALGIEPDKVNVTLNPFMQATEQDKTILKHSFLGNQSQAEVVDHPENEKPVDMFSNVQPSEPVYSDVNNTSTLTDSPSPEIASFTQPITQPIVQPPVPDLPMPPNLPDDFSNIPPIGPAVSGYAMPVENVFTPQPQTSMPNKNDPAQFRIPGQQ